MAGHCHGETETVQGATQMVPDNYQTVSRQHNITTTRYETAAYCIATNKATTLSLNAMARELEKHNDAHRNINLGTA